MSLRARARYPAFSMRTTPHSAPGWARPAFLLCLFVLFLSSPLRISGAQEDERQPTNARDLRNRLEALLDDEPEGASIDGKTEYADSFASLLGVALDDRNAVADRLSRLKEEKEALAARIPVLEEAITQERAEEPSASNDTLPTTDAEQEEESITTAAAEDPELALRRNLAATQAEFKITDLKIDYLAAVLARLDSMTEASRRILPTLGQERTSLRRHAERLRQLAEVLEQATHRLENLAGRASDGLLVGFVSERRALAEDLAAAGQRALQQSEQFSALSNELLALSGEMEETAQATRQQVLRSIVRPETENNLDAAFMSHLRAQRRLRKLSKHGLAIPGEETLEALREETNRIVPTPGSVGTTADARTALESSVETQTRLDAALSAEATSHDEWRLAFENELVTVLSGQASREARTQAYGFSSEIVDDVTSEIELAWRRLRLEAQRRRQEIPSVSDLLYTEQGRGSLLRWAGALGVLGLWFFLRGQASRISVFLVKTLARMPTFRGSVGRLVRWFGLLESIFPSLLALIALSVALLILGPNSTISWPLRILVPPLILYVLGRQILTGATRRITRGRPALVEVRPATLANLQRTYARLGFFVAIGYIVDGIARVTIGEGRVVTLVDAAVLAWVGVWAAAEAVHWRVPLSEAWVRLLPERDPAGSERRIADWMAGSKLGFLLSPLALGRVSLTPLIRFVRNLATSTHLIQSMRTRLLRRRSKQVTSSDEPATDKLPREYLDAFPLHPKLGEDDALIVRREPLVKEVHKQISHWQESRADGSLVLIGEQGVGKTTLAGLIGKSASGLEVVHHTVTGKPSKREELIRSLSTVLGLPVTGDVEVLCKAANAGPERMVLLDEAHNVFLRRVDGYDTYDALVELVNGTGEKIFWVLVFNSFTWRFLNESRGRVRYFRKVMQLPSWSPEEIQDLILLRHERTGFQLQFDELLLSDDQSGSGEISIVEESEGYFRLLWDSSGGNPRIATELWLASLSPCGDQKLRVGVFREPSNNTLASLKDDLLFALAATCQHENLSAEELGVVLNMPERFGSFAVQYLAESGLLEAKDDRRHRYTLAPRYYRSVLRTLKNKHLLFD